MRCSAGHAHVFVLIIFVFIVLVLVLVFFFVFAVVPNRRIGFFINIIVIVDCGMRVADG